MASNKSLDWEKIEKLFRLGQLSVQEIARQHKTHASTITRRAERDGWTRDMAEVIRQRANAKLLTKRDAVVVTQADIAVAVETVVEVVREHRAGIAHGRNIVTLLMGQLTDVAGKRNEFEAIIETLTEDDKTTERRTKLMKAVSLPTHAGMIRDLSAALKNLIPLERQSFNIGGEDKPPEQPATASQVASEFAELRERFKKVKAHAQPT